MNLIAVDPRPTRWFWLSFADSALPAGSQLLGVAVVGPAFDFGTAVMMAHLNGCNPGGEVMGDVIPERLLPLVAESQRMRVMERAEAEALMATLDGAAYEALS